MPRKGGPQKGKNKKSEEGGGRVRRKTQQRGGPRQFTNEEELDHQQDPDSEEKEEEKNSEEGSEESEESPNEEEKESEKKEAKHKGPVLETANLNRNAERAPEHIKASNLDVNKAKPELSRREREELDKQRRKQQYMEAYAAGRTPEAQADLARLQRIRREREAAAKRKEEEAQAKEEAKKTAREKSQGRKASTYL